MTTRSPTLSFVTPAPTSTTTPIGSWPSTSPRSMNGPSSSYRWRSDPQIAEDVMRMTASVGSWMTGSGTSSTVTLRVPCQVSAFIVCSDPWVSSHRRRGRRRRHTRLTGPGEGASRVRAIRWSGAHRSQCFSAHPDQRRPGRSRRLRRTDRPSCRCGGRFHRRARLDRVVRLSRPAGASGRGRRQRRTLPGIPVVVGVGATRTSHVQALADDAQDAGASAVLLAPVSYQPSPTTTSSGCTPT